MDVWRVAANVFTYAAAIGASQKALQWTVAVQLLFSMEEAAVTPNVVTYSATISACAEQWATALELVHHMRSARVTPNSFSYSAAISACERATEWSATMALFADMASDKAGFGSVLFLVRQSGPVVIETGHRKVHCIKRRFLRID